jgi:hypothetical protein
VVASGEMGLDPQAELLRAIHSRAARIAVGPSTVRGRGNSGVVLATRNFLLNLDLKLFSTGRATVFRSALDRTTKRLVQALPSKARSWGLARKVLNIFLRDALYTAYLRDSYELGSAEAYYELPLDSVTATELKRTAGRGVLPPWPGVKHVTPALSDAYQKAAQRIAQRRGIHRVHLDAYWWSVSRD